MRDHKIELIGNTFCSLVSILTDSGLDNEQISRLFREASDAVEGKSEPEFQQLIIKKIEMCFAKDMDADDAEAIEEEICIDDEAEDSVRSEINQIIYESPAYKSLLRIDKNLHYFHRNAYRDSEDEADQKNLDKTFSLLVEFIDFSAEAEKVIEDECQKRDVRFFLNKKDWAYAATDSELGKEGDIFFFSDIYLIQRIQTLFFSEWKFRGITTALANGEDFERLNRLKELVSTVTYVFPFNAINIIDAAVQDIALMKEVNAWYISQLQDAPGGVQRSRLVDDATNIFKTPNANMWFEHLVERKLVMVVKNSSGKWWAQLY